MSTTFAETLKTYADGQRSVEPFPEEMAFYGFVPPLRTPTGDLTAGDVLTAQWTNAIFRDVFRAQQQLKSFDLRTDGNADSALDIKIGALRLVIINMDASATGPINFPTGLAFKSEPLVMLFNSNSTASAGTKPTSVTDVTTTGFSVAARDKNKPGAAKIAAGRTTMLFVGEHTDAVTAAPERAMFAEFEKVYADGQTTWTSPSADQWNVGFVPTYTAANGKIVQGDQLAANVLNFILCDLFRKGGRGVVINGGYVLQAGPLKVEMWSASVQAGGDRLAFPEPFRKGSTPFVMVNSKPASGAAADDLNGASIGINTQDPANVHSWTGTIRVWDAAATPVSIDGNVNIMAVGMGDRQVSLQRYYDSFADTAKTYPDGQKNVRAMAAAMMESGFKPPVRNSDGSFTKGDQITAQDINGLFKLAYEDAKATLTPRGGQLVETTSGWTGAENSLYWYAWTTRTGLTAADWATGLKLAPVYPIKAGTKMLVLASDTAGSDHAIISVSATESNATQTILRAYSYKNPGVAATPSAIRILAMGIKP